MPVTPGTTDTSQPSLTTQELAKLGGFVALLAGLYMFDRQLGVFIGLSAIVVIALRGGLFGQ
jgi:hypothetical protein